MTRLEELLCSTSQEELHELYAFWDGDGQRPPQASELAAALALKMSDEAQVRRRLRFLSRKLVDLLRFFLGRRQFEADVESIRGARSFGFMSPHEVEAAVRALVKRGFLFPRVTNDSEPARFVVATELGQLLQRELEDLDLELSASFSLQRMLTARGEPAEAGDVAKLLAPDDLARRVASLTPEVRDLFERAQAPGGGLLPRMLVARGTLDPGAAIRRQVKESLEAARLGTVRHLELGEYGINHFDETLIVFEEVLSAELERRAGAAPPVATTPTPTHVRSLGVDLLSDLSLILERLTRENVRFTQSGQIYRAAAKKIEDELILGTKGEFDAERLFAWLLDLAQQRHLLRRTPERTLQLTSKGRTWPRLSVHFKLKELLTALLEDLGRQFHPPRLRRLALERMRQLKPGPWYDFGLFVGAVRQRYLAQLEEGGLREAYQSRFQYSPEAHLRDLPQLSQVIAQFVGEDLHLLGLVDLALEQGRPVALSVTPLAVKALGLTEVEETKAKSRLLVNSDFEILLLPEGDCYELIQRLDRFAERVNTEDAHRFRITPKSVERAVAGGMTATEILETLSAQSSLDLPQNVVVSVREYAEKVRFVHLRKVLLLTARHREVIDLLLKRAEIRKLVQERLGPRVVALVPEIASADLTALLEEEGVFLVGEGAAAEGNGNGHGGGNGAPPIAPAAASGAPAVAATNGSEPKLPAPVARNVDADDADDDSDPDASDDEIDGDDDEDPDGGDADDVSGEAPRVGDGNQNA
jgi:DNA-binding MarR family transcriptional regulator